MFVVVVIKMIGEFFSENFKDYYITDGDNCEMYCLIIKIIIGLNVVERGYYLLNSKHTDP